MLELSRSVVLLVDVQGKLATTVTASEAILARQALLLRAAKLLDLPVIVAEQVPEKLGSTDPRLLSCLERPEVVAKQSFACSGEPVLMDRLSQCGRDQVVIAGIESHVCVWQTVTGLLRANYQVYPLADAISARRELDHQMALQRMSAAGATLMTVEMALFEWMGSVTHPAFRGISQLLKQADVTLSASV
jgi:nicotinamidase-related amidase